MAACISRGPKTTSASQHTSVAAHPNSCSQQQQQQQQQYNQIIKIYTEWGNHYLEKARFKKLIQNLQIDLSDGVLLADVVEAVCGQKVPDINRKPKSANNMVENVVLCLTLLERIGVTLDGITAKDVRDGNLKTILGLFFSLSKFKQQQKQRQASQALFVAQHSITSERLHQKRQHLAPPSDDMKQSRLPSPYYNQQPAPGAGTSIPTPVTHRPSRAAVPGLNSLKCSSSANSSRSASPSHSFIPTPKSGLNSARSSLNEKQLMSIRNGNKIPPGNNLFTASTVPARNSVNEKVKGTSNSSGSKEKNKSIVISSNTSANSAKRTSSSSGVSSTRSERSSDSSNSICNDVTKLANEPKENSFIFTTHEVKPVLKKKVTVKPIETRAIKLPNKATSFRIDEKTSTIVQDPSNTAAKEDNKSVMNESCRLSSSGIPKPTAAVKGTAKPTNSVAPMPIVKPEIEEKPVSTIDDLPGKKVKQEIIEKHDDISNHSKQSSLGDEDESGLVSVKPMEPILRGYKRGVIFPRRVNSSSVYTSQRLLNCQPQQFHHHSRFDMKKVNENDDFEITSGYVSDGDVLQANCSNVSKYYGDVDNGYMSEGGAQFYERYSHNLELRLGKTARKHDSEEKSNNLSSLSNSSHIKQILADRVQSTDVLTALSSGSPLHKFGNKLNGRGLGPDDGPTSPPEPTPTHAGSYCTTFRSSPPRMSPPEPTPVVYRVVGARSHIKKSDSGQQTDNSSFSRTTSNCNSQWKKYTEANVNSASLQNASSTSNDHLRGRNEHVSDNVRIREKRSPSVGPCTSNTGSLLRNKMDKRRTSSTSSSREELVDMDHCNGERKSRSDGKNKVRGVPTSFGYVKRPTNANGKESRTAQVSAVPRTKVKVSGGTQTDMKSYSLSSAAASQLSQSVRERIMSGSDSVTKSPVRSQNSHKSADRDSLPGSLSDSTYTDLQMISNQSSWFRHGSPYTASLPTRSSAVAGLMDAESIESLPAQLPHRASLTNARLLSGSGSPGVNAPSRLSRSNSIRSTKSEKLYPSMLQRSDELEPLYSIPYNLAAAHNHISNNCNSQDEPPSPTPSHLSQATSAGNSSRYHYAASPSSSSQSYSRNSPYMSFLTKMNSKEEDMHGSAMSLVSTGSSSLYSTPEEKQVQEVRRLRKDLSEAQQKVHSLTSQISTNAHVVSAFQDSLTKMTERLQQLTATNEKKDSELTEARKIIEMLRKQNGENTGKDNGCSPSLARRHTINTTIDSNSNNNISRQLSTDSVSSLVSMSSACSMSSGNQHIDLNALDKNKKKRGWLRSSFSKAFSRSKKNRNGSVSDIEDSRTTQSDVSAPSSPLLNSPHLHNGCLSNDYKNSALPPLKSSLSSSELRDTIDALANDEGDGGSDVVQKLKKELREKDMVLTDIRLEALSSADQLESLKDTVMKMRNDMLLLKQDNERLQRIVTSKSLVSSQSSLQTHDCIDRRYSTTDVPTERSELDLMFTDPLDMDAKKVAVWVFFGSHGGYHKYVDERNERNECPISLIPVSTKTNWEALDSLVFRAFKEYLDRTDPGTNLDLTQDSIWSYHVGEVVRYKDSKEPELLPCGYLVGGSASSITVCLKGALHSGCLDALAFEMLIPKSIVQRYVTLLSEHRRIMLYGPGGTGKTCLASKLAEYVLYRDGKEITPNSIATFNVDEKSSKDLRQYLSNLAEQSESNSTNNELPSAIILDNLHLASSLTDVLNSVVGLKSEKYCPYIIGTLNQSNCSSSNLQLHHNFRWVLFANHLEPVKGFLSRYLRRRLIEIECKKASRNPELRHIVEWIPKIQQHLNQFLETHASSDVTIGPKLFMSCPMEVDGSQVWFTDLWNYSLVPYLLDAVRDGLQLYGKRAPWEDPSSFIRRNYPWCKSTTIHGGIEALMRLRPEDVGYDVKPEADPLLNMLMTLQEAANYSSSTHSNESDSANTSNIAIGMANSSI